MCYTAEWMHQNCSIVLQYNNKVLIIALFSDFTAQWAAFLNGGNTKSFLVDFHGSLLTIMQTIYGMFWSSIGIYCVCIYIYKEQSRKTQKLNKSPCSSIMREV